jgi:hypothetical protein
LLDLARLTEVAELNGKAMMHNLKRRFMLTKLTSGEGAGYNKNVIVNAYFL